MTIRILTASIGPVNNKNLNKEKKIMETISVTIPREKEALIKTADYLRNLAGVSQEVTISPTIIEEPLLDPKKEAADMGDRIDKTVEAAGAGASTPELDKSGTPRDGRIHASSKAFVADGTWRLKRGVDPELVRGVTIEIKRAFQEKLLGPVETPAAVAPPVVETPAVVAPVVETPAVVAPVVETPAVVAPPAVVETPAVVAPPVETPAAVAPVAITGYAALIPQITAQAAAQILQANDVMDALNSTGAFAAGVVNLTELGKEHNAAYIPLVAAELERVWATRV